VTDELLVGASETRGGKGTGLTTLRFTKRKEGESGGGMGTGGLRGGEGGGEKFEQTIDKGQTRGVSSDDTTPEVKPTCVTKSKFLQKGRKSISGRTWGHGAENRSKKRGRKGKTRQRERRRYREDARQILLRVSQKGGVERVVFVGGQETQKTKKTRGKKRGGEDELNRPPSSARVPFLKGPETQERRRRVR